MWYEILPAMGVIFASVTIPQVAAFFISKLFQSGNAYRRKLSPHFNQHIYMRDLRLTNNPYVIVGLDNIPDAKPEDEQGKSKRKPCVQEEVKEEVVKKCPISIQEDKPEVLPKPEVGKCVTSEDMFKIPEKDDKK